MGYHGTVVCLCLERIDDPSGAASSTTESWTFRSTGLCQFIDNDAFMEGIVKEREVVIFRYSVAFALI